MKPRRFQLKKEAVGLVRHHPWLFRDHLSSAAAVFNDGDWLRLYDGQNHVVGHGVYAAEGAIAVRVLRAGDGPVNAAYVVERLETALAKRATLAETCTGIRLVNGESDGLPAIVADRFGDSIVVTCYATGLDGIAMYLARTLAGTVHAAVGRATNVVLRSAHRRVGGEAVPPRVVRGALGLATFREDGLAYTVDLAGGQKTGAFLDLRGLRRAIATSSLTGKRVLNLFAYTGMLGRAAEHAGASSLLQVDASEPALAFARAHHVGDPARHTFETADIFEWLATHTGAYDLVICDPPAMTSKATQVPKVLAAYRKLYKLVAPLVAEGGQLVAACCTSRIQRDAFRAAVASATGYTFEKELPPEADHPAGFPQADYLKVTFWRRPAAT